MTRSTILSLISVTLIVTGLMLIDTFINGHMSISSQLMALL